MNGLARILGDNLSGAWAVMLGRADGMARLDCTIEGFWRSFSAVILIAPFSLIALLSQARLLAETEGAGANAMWPWIVGLLGDWFAFPLAFALIARPLGLGGRYVPFIVARNWAAVLVSAGVSIIPAAHLLGLLPAGLTQFLLLAAVFVALRFAYIIVRTALAVPFSVALPIVAFDFLLSMTVWAAVDRLGG